MKPPTKLVYIAGPYRDANAWMVHCNVNHAESLAMRVARRGMMPLCPHTNTRNFNGTLTDEFWLAGTMLILSRCDAMMLTDDWITSSGARAEVEYAEANSIPVFESLDDLCAWRDAQAAERNGEVESPQRTRAG
uniref:DUF7768 domain-containing protein n=1 Tax=viral metagenome TaxID=1070528 RepID=A0A6M3IYL3_9ZZZZ